MARKKTTRSRKKSRTGKRFRFQLSLSGLLGIGVVCFCLFLWMFLLGIWAGQTILLPPAEKERRSATVEQKPGRETQLPVIRPESRKRAVTPGKTG
ncbi:hypothetical protein GF1_08060 [Desulfolithobacter dissulfuricans]|uniref:Uncharacterized protein n=1 Tax=Desulfolithobacter dissulfuricans TaxID=2795293 RepID=A0A915U0B8_9BACT|nr:hypothetical protein [Desulfolithobacter dissulfuricans]BCO08430.1 hypothetical protein GF1_08060 [Desulfolithobacter dissulfuricans]